MTHHSATTIDRDHSQLLLQQVKVTHPTCPARMITRSRPSLYFLVAVQLSTSRAAGARGFGNKAGYFCTSILLSLPASSTAADWSDTGSNDVVIKKERGISFPGGAPGRVVLSRSIDSASGRDRLQAGPQLRHSRPRLLRPLLACRCLCVFLARGLLRWQADCVYFAYRTSFQDPVGCLCIL
jgi:hypothetical protein